MQCPSCNQYVPLAASVCPHCSRSLDDLGESTQPEFSPWKDLALVTWDLHREHFIAAGVIGTATVGFSLFFAFCAPNLGQGYSVGSLRQNVGRTACNATNGISIGRIVGVAETTLTPDGSSQPVYRVEREGRVYNHPISNVELCR